MLVNFAHMRFEGTGGDLAAASRCATACMPDWCSYARKITPKLLHKCCTVTSMPQLCSNFRLFLLV